MANRKKAPEALDPAAVRAVFDEVRREGAVLRAALPKLGVPRSRAAEAAASLAEMGLEITAKAIRVTAREQLEARLRERPLLPLRNLHQQLRAVSKKEAVEAGTALVKEGAAAYVVRSKELSLARPGPGTLDEAALGALERAITTLSSATKLARKKGATLLRDDVAQALARFAQAPAKKGEAATRSEGARPVDEDASLDDLMVRHREPSGLTFVPKLVRALGGATARDSVHEELLRGARAGHYELRPESGMGRLSDEEMSLSIPGPQGSRLSWVRRREETR